MRKLHELADVSLCFGGFFCKQVVLSSGSFLHDYRGEVERLIFPVWADNEAGRY